MNEEKELVDWVLATAQKLLEFGADPNSAIGFATTLVHDELQYKLAKAHGREAALKKENAELRARLEGKVVIGEQS